MVEKIKTDKITKQFEFNFILSHLKGLNHENKNFFLNFIH
jgi:hypothetical protein